MRTHAKKMKTILRVKYLEMQKTGDRHDYDLCCAISNVLCPKLNRKLDKFERKWLKEYEERL